MRVDLLAYSGLLAAGLGLAYWASLPAPEGEEEKVAVATFEPKAIQSVTLKTKDTEVTAEKRGDDQRFWINFQKTEAPPPPPAPAPAAPGEVAPPVPPTPAPTVVKERFLTNEKAGEMLSAFNPLQALRIIGKVEDAQLEEFGLKDKTDEFTLKTTDGKGIKLWLGKKSYGSRNRFVMEESGRVLLVDDQGFDNFERANLRLYDRRLVPFEFDDGVTHATVDAGGQKKRFAHTQRNKDGDLTWTDDAEGAEAKPSYGSWMDKIAKLRLSGYAEAADVQAAAAVPPFMTVTLEKNGQVLDTIEFRKQPGEPATYWATSKYLGTQGKLVNNRVEPIEKDMGSILGGGAPAPAGG